MFFYEIYNYYRMYDGVAYLHTIKEEFGHQAGWAGYLTPAAESIVNDLIIKARDVLIEYLKNDSGEIEFKIVPSTK